MYQTNTFYGKFTYVVAAKMKSILVAFSSLITKKLTSLRFLTSRNFVAMIRQLI